MRAGKYRHPIVIQSRVKGLDSHNGTTYTWPDFATPRAKIRPLRGRGLVAAQAAQNEATVIFYIRYLPGVDPSMRIRHDGKSYDIVSIVNVDEKSRELEISTKTGLSEG